MSVLDTFDDIVVGAGSAGIPLAVRLSADPGRRVMMERLSQGPASVSELARPLAISLAAVLQHVQVLEASGLVRSQKTGRTRTCSINPAALRSAEQWISARRALWERFVEERVLVLEAGAVGTPPGPARRGPGGRPARGRTYR